MTKQEQLEEIFTYYAQQSDLREQSMLVAMMREIQDCMGYVSSEHQAKIASMANTPISVIQKLIQFYSDIKTTPTAHEITVCTGARCASKQAGSLLSFLRKELMPDDDGLSSDGKFRLNVRCCFRECPKGANVMIDNKMHHAMTLPEMRKILNTLKKA